MLWFYLGAHVSVCHVFLEVGLPVEASSTDVALVRLDAGVDPLVNRQVVLCVERFATNPTLEHLCEK